MQNRIRPIFLSIGLFLGLFASAAHAQTASPQTLITDTLLPGGLRTGDSYCDDLVINCVRPDCRKGYVTGNNRYGFREVLLKYRFAGPGLIHKCFIDLGRKIMANPASATYAVYYEVDAEGYPDSTTRKLSGAATMGQLHDGAYQTFAFDTAVAFADSFFVGFVLPVTDGDTIGVYQTHNRHASPCATPNDTLAYERYTDGHFARSYDTWETVFELGIKVEVEYDYVATRSLLAGRVEVKPVPAQDHVTVSLPEGARATGWQLTGLDGRVWQQSNSPEKAAGFPLSRGNAPAGVYLLQIRAPAGRVVKRVLFAD
jgi:hypothetical protein